jgi:ParB-like chromosome segregation protein Spo0J
MSGSQSIEFVNAALDGAAMRLKASEWPADQVERRKVERPVPYAQNARTHSEEQIGQLARSIEEWGFTVPVLIDENDSIIAGHGLPRSEPL